MKYRSEFFSKVSSNSDYGKALMIIGPRRVGKTVLLKEINKSVNQDVLLLNGEDPATSSLLLAKTLHQYKQLLGKEIDTVLEFTKELIKKNGEIGVLDEWGKTKLCGCFTCPPKARCRRKLSQR